MVTIAKISELPAAPASANHADLDVAVLTGCKDRPYAFGLVMALVSKGARVDMIGSNEEDIPALHVTPNLRFLNLRGSQNDADKFSLKLRKLMFYYARLLRYAMRSKPAIFHILWNNKIEFFDRTLLM